jgi:hypothetical protein
VCSFGVYKSGDDGTDSKTQVLPVRCAWVHVATSCHARHLMSSFPVVLTLVVPVWYRKPQVKRLRTQEHLGPGEEMMWADRWRNPIRP